MQPYYTIGLVLNILVLSEPLRPTFSPLHDATEANCYQRISASSHHVPFHTRKLFVFSRQEIMEIFDVD